MVRVCDELRADHDFVLIDSAAGIERGFRYAIAPADRVLVVTNPEVSAVRDADRVVGILEAEGKAGPALIINRLNPAMVKQHDMLSAADILDLLAVKLIGVVPEDDGVIVGSNRGTPVALDPKEPGRPGLQEHCPAPARPGGSVHGPGGAGRVVGSTAKIGEEVRWHSSSASAVHRMQRNASSSCSSMIEPT
jgi:hypothetical protein